MRQESETASIAASDVTKRPAPVDLQPAPAWEAAVPPGWGPVGVVCLRVREGLEDLTDEIVRAIAAEIDEYGDSLAVPRADLSASVFRNGDMMLHGIAEHRGPRDDELEIRRQLGRRRAQQEIPVHSLLAAYHIGYRELWSALIAEAKRSGDSDAQSLLLDASATVWGWIHEVTNAVASDYQLQRSLQRASDSRARAHFFELLLHDPESEECANAARGFGLDPLGAFQCFAVLATAEAPAHPAAENIKRAGGGAQVRCERGRVVVTITQRCAAEQVTRDLEAFGPVGIGLERAGLPGARLSAQDAERSLEIALIRGEACRFDDVWLEASVVSQRRSLTPIIDGCAKVAAERPDLAQTVRAFAASDLSIADTARVLRLAPNSVRHRLTQWQRLTGWNPWTVSGMAQTLVALDLLTL